MERVSCVNEVNPCIVQLFFPLSLFFFFFVSETQSVVLFPLLKRISSQNSTHIRIQLCAYVFCGLTVCQRTPREMGRHKIITKILSQLIYYCKHNVIINVLKIGPFGPTGWTMNQYQNQSCSKVKIVFL